MNRFSSPRNTFLLVIGDIIVHFFSLIISLGIRYQHVPTRTLLLDHIPSFLILWTVFILISFIAGLYDKRTGLIRNRITGPLLSVQIINTILGIIFFYLAPVGITPKANLLIYSLVSTGLLFIWRLVMFPVFSITRRQDAIIVGDGEAISDLKLEINAGPRYGFVFNDHINTKDSVAETVTAISKAVENTGASLIVADLNNRTIEKAIPFLYSLIFSGIQIVDASRVYENVFDRVPLSIVKERWLIEQSTTALGIRYIYDTIKRVMDIIVSVLIGAISLIFYPLIYIAIKIEDGGSLFVMQERVGKDGKHFKMYKFRSMTANDSGAYINNKGKSSLKVTNVGKFIRLTRIDELPQLWSVLKGDQSLIGPRPELPALTKVYEEQIPYYNARHLIKPGLSGWAQISHKAHPHHAVAVDDTRDKLSYDLFYVKNRSLLLDIRIALQTLKALISRQGV